eukprot:1319367-Amorphochlora_amoeboformis.AAC.1
MLKCDPNPSAKPQEYPFEPKTSELLKLRYFAVGLSERDEFWRVCRTMRAVTLAESVRGQCEVVGEAYFVDVSDSNI